MTAHDLRAFATALGSLPTGSFPGRSQGRRYVVAKTSFTNGKSVKLLAEELGGPDYISLNLYHLRHAPRLFPCEMGTAKVMAFVMSLRPDPAHETA